MRVVVPVVPEKFPGLRWWGLRRQITGEDSAIFSMVLSRRKTAYGNIVCVVGVWNQTFAKQAW